MFLFFCNQMNRPIITLFFVFIISVVQGQKESLPADLRQHNLTTFNASLLNPAFSAGRNNPESIAFWSRWQWQGIDANPTTLFLNYTRGLNERSAAGVGFFQHNSGIFFQTGAALNYAYTFEFGPNVKLAVGANLFGFVQKLADDRFQIDPNVPLPIASDTNDFILQMAPGISLEVQRFSLSLASDNLVDYNFAAKEGNTATSDKVFMSLLSYDLPIRMGSASNSFLRPSVYLRTVPGQSNQVGFNTLLNTNGYYGQVGYNNFYGYALGGGYTFFDRLTIGALMEIGTGASLQKDTSFELMASYFLGTPEERHAMVGHDNDDINPLEVLEEKQDEELAEKEAAKEAVAADKQLKEDKKDAEKQRKEAAKEQRTLDKTTQDSVAKADKQAELAAKKQQKQAENRAKETVKAQEATAKQAELEKVEKEAEAIKAQEATAEKAKRKKAEKEAESQKMREERQMAEEVRKTDSIMNAKQTEAVALQKERQRNIEAAAEARAAAVRAANIEKEAEDKEKELEVKEEETVTPQKGEKYEEVKNEDGLQPGFYLIANVFGTQKYFEAFKADLRLKGIEPLSFLRSENGFNYVYLKRYDLIKEARMARDSKFGGKYTGNTWIFRVVRN